MTGLPTLTVKLDDGTGTFPYDVSSFVRLPDGLSIQRGRQDEFDDVSPSTLSLTFDNTTGVFTLGSGTYGIAIDQRIQVTENVTGAVKRFTGYVQDWPVAWPDGSDQYAVAQVTAVDRMSRLARRKLRSMAENEILVDSPIEYFTMGDSEGSLAAGDTSGRGTPALTAIGTGAAPVFGNATGPGTDGLSAVTLAGEQYLSGGTFTPSSTSMTVELAFNVAAAPPSLSNYTLALVTSSTALTVGVQLSMDSAGKVFESGSGLTTTTSFADGGWHHVAYKMAGTSVELFVDGVSQGTATLGSALSTSAPYTVSVGYGGTLILSGSVAHLAITQSSLSSARILAHYTAQATGFATDTSDQRVARLASYGNIPTADQSLETGQSVISAQSPSGQNVLQAMQDVVTAEGGLVFIQGDGKLVMQNKTHRPGKAVGAAALALTADQINPDVAPGGAKTYLLNTATGSRSGGAEQSSVNAASVTAYEEYSTSIDRALLATDAQVLDVLTWTTATYGTPRPRIQQLTLDLLTLPNATAQTILGLEIGDLITLSGMPTQTPASLGNLLVEGWSESLTHDSWTVTLNTVPAAVFQAPIVDLAGATCDTGYPVYF